MRTGEKIYAAVVAGWLSMEHLFSLFKFSADLFPSGCIRYAILLPLTCGTNHITKAGLITAFHLLDIKMVLVLVKIVFVLSESHLYLLFSEGMVMQVALGSTGCHIEIRLRIKLALRKAEGRDKNTWSLLIYLRDYY